MSALFYEEPTRKASILVSLLCCILSAVSLSNSLPCSGSPTHEAEEPASPLFNEPHQVTSDGQQRPGGSQLCLRDLCVTPDGAGMIIEFYL